MRIIFIFYLQFVSVCILSQDQYIHVKNYINAHQAYLDLECRNEFCFALGGTVCSTGECSVIAKYGSNGE